MRFSSLVSFMTLGSIAFAIPAPKAEPDLETRQLGNALSIVGTLGTTLDGVLLSVSELSLVTIAATSALTPLVSEVVFALETATTNLELLSSVGGLGLEKRADQQEFAQKVATITTKIATTFGPIKGNRHFSIFGGLLAEIDFALKGLLFSVNFLVDGILITIAGLIGTVVGTLDGLLFTLTIGILGIL